MDNIDSLKIQRREVSDNIGRVTKEIIMMEEVLKETENKILGMEFEMVSKDSDKWNDIVSKAKKFRERISHLKSERRRFIRMEQSFEKQIEEMQKKVEAEEQKDDIKELEEKKKQLAAELEKMRKEREKTEGVLQKLNRERLDREEKIQKAAEEDTDSPERSQTTAEESSGEKTASQEIEDILAQDLDESPQPGKSAPKPASKEKETVKPEGEPKDKKSQKKINTLKDLAKMYKTLDKKEEEDKETETDIQFPPPKPLDKLKFSISEFSTSDLKEIIDIETFSFPRPWRRYMFYKEMEIPVSKHFTLKANDGVNKFIMAYAVYWITNKKMDIKNFAVHPSYRLQGIGTKFLKAIINKARAAGAKTAKVIVRKSNTAGLELAKKLDFKQTEIKEEYFGFKKEDGIVMEREINK